MREVDNTLFVETIDLLCFGTDVVGLGLGKERSISNLGRLQEGI